MYSMGTGVCSDESTSSTVSCPWPHWAGRALLAVLASLPLTAQAVQPLYKSYEVFWGALGWGVGGCCGNGEVMLDWEARSVCVVGCVCMCDKKLRIKTGRETPRGKQPGCLWIIIP